MSTTPLTTVARVVRTTALGSEILAHRIDTWATNWAASGHDSPDTTPRQDTETRKRDTTRKRDKSRRHGLTRRARTAIVTLLPIAVLLIAMSPSSLGALFACGGLYLITIVTLGYSPTAALLAVYASIATMWPTLMAGAALIWLPTAYRAASRDPLLPGGEETLTEVPDEPAEDALIALVRNLIGDRYGAHLRDVVEALNQSSTGRQFTAPEVRAALAQRGVPTRSKVRAPQGGIQGAPETVTRGVHRDDLPAAPGPSEMHTDDPSQASSPEAPADPVATTATSL